MLELLPVPDPCGTGTGAGAVPIPVSRFAYMTVTSPVNGY